MPMRLLAGWVAMSFLALCVASQAKSAAKPLECPTEASGALMPASYRGYPEAAELARILSDDNFVVKCICLSMLDGFVPGTRGAALYVRITAISTWYFYLNRRLLTRSKLLSGIGMGDMNIHS